jgi:tRNA threonylcarbamoyladenosine biosynthesis protein TsaE
MGYLLQVVTHSPEETRNLGRLIGTHAQPGDVYLLSGPLGAGKTCLVQGLVFGLGAGEHARSPSFVIVNHYKGRLETHHIDLYRLNEHEAADLGLEECLEGDGVCAVEWPERALSFFSPNCLKVAIDYGESVEDRIVTLNAHGERYRLLIDALVIELKSRQRKA